jgi:phosphate/sulfate permease
LTETVGGAILTSMAFFGFPVSTTHAIAGSIMGVGATRRLSAVRWGVGKRLDYNYSSKCCNCWVLFGCNKNDD